MSILNQKLLTLDFWQDKVTYVGHTLPTGSIGCAAMNISDEQIGQLIQLAVPLTTVVELIKAGTPRAEVFHPSRNLTNGTQTVKMQFDTITELVENINLFVPE